MIFLYSLALMLLGGLKFLVERRAAALGRKYSVLADGVQKRLRELMFKPGNGVKPDPCAAARNQFELGCLVQKRDRLEAKHFGWQAWADKLGWWTRSLKQWRGKKLPYTLGAVDVWLALSLVDHFGVADFVSARALYDLVAGLWQ